MHLCKYCQTIKIDVFKEKHFLVLEVNIKYGNRFLDGVIFNFLNTFGIFKVLLFISRFFGFAWENVNSVFVFNQ